MDILLLPVVAWAVEGVGNWLIEHWRWMLVIVPIPIIVWLAWLTWPRPDMLPPYLWDRGHLDEGDLRLNASSEDKYAWWQRHRHDPMFPWQRRRQ